MWKARPFIHSRERLIEWLVYFGIGLTVGSIAFVMKIIEEGLVHLANYVSFGLFLDGNGQTVPAWLVYITFCGFYGFVASSLTTYVSQAAAGSGVAELIGYVNGVNYHDFIGLSTLFVKVIGVVFAVSGKLAVGKEGPLAHIGAICGAMVVYTPCIDLRHLQFDE